MLENYCWLLKSHRQRCAGKDVIRANPKGNKIADWVLDPTPQRAGESGLSRGKSPGRFQRNDRPRKVHE